MATRHTKLVIVIIGITLLWTIPFWWIVVPMICILLSLYIAFQTIPLLNQVLKCLYNCRCHSFNCKTHTAVLYCSPTNQQSRPMSEAIAEWITSSYACISFDNSANSTSHDAPVIAVCINATRIVDDVSSSIQDLKVSNYKRFAIVIFHPQTDHETPPIASNLMLPDPLNEKDVFDLTYNARTQSMYQSDSNHKALNDIADFIRMAGKYHLK